MVRSPVRTTGVAVATCCVALLACGSLLPGCGGAGGEAVENAGSTSDPAARRIVSLSPNVTEILYALDLGERVVGVDDFSDHPPAARDKPRVGGYLDPDLEKIVSLHPDLAVVLEAQGELAAELEALGVPVLVVDNQDLADVESSMVELAARAGVGSRGEELARRFRAALAPRQLPRQRRVMIVVGRGPGRSGEVLVAGPDSFPHELVSRLGAENVFSDLGRRYATVGAEEVLARRPEVVLDLHHEKLPAEAEAAMAAEWRDLLGEGVEVAVIDGPETVIPGPRLPRLYDRLEAALR